MPSPFDPAPAPASDPSAGQAPPGAPGTTDLASQWRDWVGRPDNRAALMQFGVAMMQPLGLGETSLSHAASAVGSGGEAAARVQGQELKEREASSKEELRGSQANLAESRAATAGARSEASAARLGVAQQRLSMQEQQMQANQRIRAMLGYQGYLKQHSQQQLIDPKGAGQPLSFDEWASQMGVGVTPNTQVPQSTIEAIRQGLQSADPQVKAQAESDAAALRKRGVTI